MSDQSGPSPFQSLFESALQDYENQTGIPLANHPLAEQLQNCQSVESVTALLQEKAQAFNEFRGSDKIFKSLKGVASALSRVSAIAAFSEAVGVSFPPAHAIHTGIAILLTAFKGVSADMDDLMDLLESIEHFLKRLDIYTKVPQTPAMTEIVVKIIVELLSTLALATKHIRQGRLKKFVKKLFGENEVEAVLHRLDRLTQDEARTTAAQMLDVVYGLVQNMRVVIDDGKASADTVRDGLEMIQQMASEMNKLKRDKLQQDVRGWLSPPDPWKNQNIARGSRHTGTAAWFVRGSTLSEWKSSGPSSLLWIHGKPGAGKSVLCSAIIENINSMMKSGLASLAFFYCDFREDEKRDLRGLLSSVLVQLCHQSDSYYRILSSFYLEHKNGSQHPGDDELQRCLKDILEVPGQAPVYLIIDGLDECSNTSALPSPREKVLTLLEDLVDSRLPNLRVCVTSRPEIDIKVALEPLTFRSVSLHDESGQMEDIDNYIKSVINKDPKMRRWKAADKELVTDVLIKKSDGMFRWVYCQIVYLRLCLPGRIRHALDELPETLDETYEVALQNINKANWEFAYRLLQCVAVAFRPLRVAELAEVLSFDFKTGHIPKFHEDLRLEDPVEAVLSTTSSLLTIVDVEGSPVIQFSHFSVKEYLTSDRLAQTNDIISRRYHISMTPAHTLAAQACLGILLHLDINVINRDNLEKYPLAEYAAEHWTNHARFEGVSGNVEDGMKRLFDPNEQHLAIWVWIYDPVQALWQRTSRVEMPLQPRGSPLHYAAFWGSHAIVKFLIIQHSQDVNSLGFNNEFAPLHFAAQWGHEDVARLLLEHGADFTAQTKGGLTPLHLVSQLKYDGVTRELLELGTDTTAQTKDGSTPLHLASQEGHDGVSRSLLEHGADITAQTKDGSTPLHLASQQDQDDVARLLLEHGADITAQTNYGSTPLHLASQEGHDDVARSLLEHGADITAQTKDGSTPLHLASQQDHDGVTHLLLEHGADITAQTKNESTPLHLASQEGHDGVARLLLEHGADTTAQTKDGSTPLHLASQLYYDDVARLLLEHGADTTAQTKDGSTPLHLASQLIYDGVARLLLEHGADTTAQTKDGSTPLHLASQEGHDGVARLLLEHGADITAQTKDGSTSLHLASQHDHDDVARLLLEHGADITVQTRDGRTPLHLASEKYHDGVARLLLEHGADMTAQTKDGSTPLHLASQLYYDDVARLLLDHGADITAQTKDGSTPLHLASQLYYDDVARSLLEHGADITAQTKDGSTPLHLASQQYHDGVARLLLEHGADATSQNKDGSSPLDLAVRFGHAKVVHSLFECGVNVTARRKDGPTLLHLASRRGHLEVAYFLFERGVDATALNKHGWSALHLASRWGHVDVVRFLLDHGADATAQNKYGSTPLRLAHHGGHVEVARVFVERGAETTGMDVLHQGDLDLARLFERDADATALDKHG